MYFSKYEINKTKIIPQKYTPFSKKQAKGMYFSKQKIFKNKDNSQKYTPFSKKQAKRMYFSKYEIEKTKIIPKSTPLLVKNKSKGCIS